MRRKANLTYMPMLAKPFPTLLEMPEVDATYDKEYAVNASSTT